MRQNTSLRSERFKHAIHLSTDANRSWRSIRFQNSDKTMKSFSVPSSQSQILERHLSLGVLEGAEAVIPFLPEGSFYRDVSVE
jgi:hypothetical protein